MYYAVHQEDHHDLNAKSLSPGCNAVNTCYFSGHDSVTIKPKEIITSKQLAQLILTQGSTFLLQSFPPLLSSPPRCDGIRASSVAAAALSSRASCQSALPGDVALQRLPAPTQCQPGLPDMCDPRSSWVHRPRDTTSQPTGALGFSHWPS